MTDTHKKKYPSANATSPFQWLLETVKAKHRIGKSDDFYCPGCKGVNLKLRFRYCPDCGTRLIWEV